METDRDSQFVTLRDGRRLGFTEYGKSDGIPLMLFHGTPGSRLFPRLEQAEWVQRLGFRVLTPERPGYGLSDPAPTHTIIDWPDDVEQLADQLGLDRFHVAGGSGGGPFALACALRLPARVRSATLVLQRIASGMPAYYKGNEQGQSTGVFSGQVRTFAFAGPLSPSWVGRSGNRTSPRVKKQKRSFFRSFANGTGACCWHIRTTQAPPCTPRKPSAKVPTVSMAT